MRWTITCEDDGVMTVSVNMKLKRTQDMDDFAEFLASIERLDVVDAEDDHVD